MSVRIRPMRASDLAAIALIEKQITWSRQLNSLRRELAAMIRGRKGICLVAEVDGRVGGFIVGDVAPWEFGEDEKVAWIKVIGVDPKHQGEGLGKKLGHALLAELRKRGIRRVKTLVEWYAGDMLAYFQTLGFDRSGAIVLERDVRGR